MLEMLQLTRPVEAQWLIGCLWSSVSQQQMAVPAGQDGARRLRNGMMPLRPDWNTAWHIYVQKHTSHTIFWNCTETETQLVCILELVVGLKNQAFPSLSEEMSFVESCSGDWQFEPFQEAESEVAPRHWHGHGNRWNYSFPMVWPPFPGPLGGTCVSASGIWVRWSAIFIRIVARKTSIHLETERASCWFTRGKKSGISLIILSATLSILSCCAFQITCLTLWLILPKAMTFSVCGISWCYQIKSCQNLIVLAMSFQSRVLSECFSKTCLSKVKVMNVGVVKTGGCVCTQRAERSCSDHANHTGTSAQVDVNQVFSQSSQTSCPAPA